VRGSPSRAIKRRAGTRTVLKAEIEVIRALMELFGESPIGNRGRTAADPVRGMRHAPHVILGLSEVKSLAIVP
jgi:hypothetical protein